MKIFSLILAIITLCYSQQKVYSPEQFPVRSTMENSIIYWLDAKIIELLRPNE